MSLIPKKGNVYVVDDDEAVRDSLQWLLEGKDYRVKCFDSAESFLSRYDPREVACLIADIRMDGVTGYLVASTVRVRVNTSVEDARRKLALSKLSDEDLQALGLTRD
jgi:FixJ family two-component response regulator